MEHTLTTPIQPIESAKGLARILLVEDDPSDVVLMLAAFREMGLGDQVVVVNDGVQALDYLYARQAFRHRPPGHPAVVLLDVKLPRVDGFEVLQQIRANPATRFLPVVILTSSNQQRDLQRAYELGANGYVVKTIDFDVDNAALHAIAQYWAVANEPPPGSLPRPKPPTTE
ncbi:MAG: response regulator [Thermoguttaceae bacterium]|jgi:CheY-like chemotaxis protein